jgi:2-enoate reductase
MNAVRYFEERAKGSAGLIFTGANVVSTKYDGKRPSPEISGLNHVERLEMIADRVHAYDAKLCVQLSPGAGRVAVPNPASPPYSASALPEFWAPMITTQVLSVDDIHHLADRVGFAAWLVMKAGGDMVELHSYGGYLLDRGGF